MNLQPQAFQKDAARIAELAGYFLILTPEHPGCVGPIKEFVRELRAFLTRWDGQIVRSSDRAAVETFRRQLTGMEQHIESLYLVALRDLVEARRKWKLAETFLQAAVGLDELIKFMPADRLPALQASLRDGNPAAYAAARNLRTCMEEADKREAAYRQLRREFEEDWSERLADPLYQSIERDDVPTAIPLINTVTQKIAA